MNLMDTRSLELLKMPVKQRNTMIDSMFYDVGALTEEERAEQISPWVDQEGTILVVSPRRKNEKIRHYKNALRFINKEFKYKQPGYDVQAIAIAGVGSSALGTAALARNIADFYGCDVAGIVTGYGLADLISEGMGGWFFYGFADRMRIETEVAIENVMTAMNEEGANPRPNGSKLKAARGGKAAMRQPATAESLIQPIDSRFILPGNSDVGTLLDILIAAPEEIKLLAGHSKGCLLIDFVLHHLVNELGGVPYDYYGRLNILMLSTIAELPKPFKKVHQYIGKLDWFGKMNSNDHVNDFHEVPGAWHHLNTEANYHLKVADVLKHIPLTAK